MQSRYEARCNAEFQGGNLGRKERDALVATESYLRNGNREPDQRQIANRAGCSLRTVQRAHAAAKRLGLLAALPQWKGRNGRQTANRYMLMVPAKPVIKVRHLWRTPKEIQRLPTSNTTFRTIGRAPHPPIRTVEEQIRLLLSKEGPQIAG